MSVVGFKNTICIFGERDKYSNKLIIHSVGYSGEIEIKQETKILPKKKKFYSCALYNEKLFVHGGE